MRTLYRHANIYSVGVREATALLVDGSQIAWIGDDDTAAGLSHDGVVDLDGALVAPAFVDAHVHTTATGLRLSGLDLSGAGSLREALDLIEAHSRRNRGRAVLGAGWDETRWPERRAPLARELDRAAYGGAVYLMRVDGHSAVVSSALIAATAGVRGLPGFQADGLVTRDAHDALRITAHSSLTSSQREQAQRATRAQAAAQGIAALHEMAGPAVSSADDLAGLLTLATAEPGPEIVGYWGELFGAATALELGASGVGGDLFCDGSLGSHTAAISGEYADRPDLPGPEPRLGVAEVAEHIRQAAAVGLQAGFHAIGDAAVDRVVAGVQALLAQAASPVGGGHRIEHALMVTDPAALAGVGLIASMQPAFDATWGGAQGLYAERLGAERALTLNPFATLAAAGVPLTFGSDAPITDLSPWAAVRAAAYPQNPALAMSPRAAFLAHTRGGWRAARADADGSGTLTVGAPATFAVWALDDGGLAVDAPDDRLSRWSTDPRAAIPGLPDLRPGADLPTCRLTVLRGEVIYDDGSVPVGGTPQRDGVAHLRGGR